jgi:hypothetical protein
MIKINTQKKKTNQVVETINVCDKCKLKASSKCKDFSEFQEFYHFDFRGGYGSIFGDGNKITCDLCQYCLKELLGQYFRIEETADVY